jgi:FKBP-type peptidyl-prolyl cis-trans isomerase
MPSPWSTPKKSAEAGTAYVEKASKEAGATKTASGMIIKHTKEGTGAQPAATDQVKVHYEGRLIDGKVFDSSIARGEPATFPLNGVIPCWTEGVQTMKVGGKAQLTCPANLAYGPNGSPPTIPPQSTLVFDVELLDIVKAQ